MLSDGRGVACAFMPRDVGYINALARRRGYIHAFESDTKLVNELRRGTSNHLRVYPIHGRNKHIHFCCCGADLVSRTRTDVVCWQMLPQHLGTVRKMRGADEYVHGSKVLRLALLAILGFELDRRVVDAETLLENLFQSIEQYMMVVGAIDYNMRG